MKNKQQINSYRNPKSLYLQKCFNFVKIYRIETSPKLKPLAFVANCRVLILLCSAN